MDDALCPPKKTKQPGDASFARLAIPVASGTFAGWLREIPSASGANDRSSAPGTAAGRTWRSTTRTRCPASRAAAATRSRPSGSSQREISEYVGALGWTRSTRT